MDKWRERGFVPDSDSGSDEEEFGDLDKSPQPEGKETGVNEVPRVVITVGKTDAEEDGGHGLQDNGESRPNNEDRGQVGHGEPEEPADSSMGEIGAGEESQADYDKNGFQDGNYDSQIVPQAFDPEPLNLEMELLEDKENGGNQQQETGLSEIQASKKPAPSFSGGKDATSTKPANQTTADDRFWEPSSSPDELQFEAHITPKKARPQTPTNRPGVYPQPPEVGSENSSPLSSPPSSIKSLPDMEEPVAQETPHALDSVENMPPLSEIPEDILITATRRSGRELRQRNPIQLHPYLLEDARYQTLLKARGLRPMRVPKEQSDPAPKPNDESQDKSFEEENNLPSSSQNAPEDEFQFPPSSPVVEPSRTIPAITPKDRPQGSKSVHVRQPARVITPNRQPSGTDEHSSKRRKLTASYGRKNRTWVSDTPTQKLQRPHRIPSETIDAQRTASNVPPSPPVSGDIPSSQTRESDVFRFPPDISSMPMNTPVTEPRLTPRDIAPAETVTSGNETETHNDPIQIYSSESESENQEDQENRELERMRRRMRGVLPASHLRLDLKKRESNSKATQKRQASSAIGRDGSAKGVAKRIMRTRNSTSPSQSRNWSTAIPVSDESDTENEPPVVQETSGDALAQLMGFDVPDDQGAMDGDIPEDNRIDDMFPPVPRRPRVSGPKKSSSGQGRKNRNQVRPVDGFPSSKISHRMRQTNISSHVRKGRSTNKKPSPPKPKLPRLGILDAPDMADRPWKDQPQFMRIAARNARSRCNQGRGNPSRKFLRLGSKADTADANMSLYQWKAGSIRQNKTVSRVSIPRQRLNTQRGSQRNQTKHQHGNSRQQHPQQDPDTANPQDPEDMQEISGSHSVKGSSSRQDQGPVRPPSENVQRPIQPIQPILTGSRWVVNRGLPVSSLRRNATRPAQLEATKPSNRVSARSSAFKRSLETLNRVYNQPGSSEGYQLARFLEDSTPQAAPPEVRPSKPRKPRQPRKQRPQRIDAEAEEHRQPEIIPVEDGPDSSIQLGDDVEVLALHGFSTGAPYTVDFDITPLQFGTFFRESAFIGSGEFSRSLNVLSRDLDTEAGVTFIHLGEQTFKWGRWDQTVFSELSHVIDSIVQSVDGITQTAPADSTTASALPSMRTYRSIIRWISNTISFGDSADRLSFVEKCLALNFALTDNLPIQGLSANPPITQSQISHLRLGIFNLIFVNQVRQISLHGQVPSACLEDTNDAVRNSAQQLLTCVLSKNGLAEIQRFLEENKLHEKRDVGIGEDHPFVEAYLVVQMVLDSDICFKECLEDYTTMGLLSTHSIQPESSSNIHAMERLWHGIFALLPLDEIDQFGIFQTGSRFKKAHENWKLLKRLLSRVLGSYSTNPRNQSSSFNTYCKALFHRCFYLMNSWGWKNCKIILDTVFDFFAKNTLHHLQNEQSYGSPPFLEKLDKSPKLEVEPRDCCFHIFLKMVGRGLQLMSGVYEKKKIRNFAWRLLPNHGRTYPKEKPLHQEDLDALKNHHDLLCTLYWVTPDGYRPRLEAIRGLVDPATSHREACSINIHAWARLVRFKLSTQEDISELEAFADWHSGFTNEMVKQHSLARTEVEDREDWKHHFSRQVLESTIAKNQRQIESILNSALTSLKDSIDTAKTMEQGKVLLAKLPIVKLFGLFNLKTPRINAVVSHTLDVIMAFARTDARSNTGSASIDASEDSQDYGDWGVFEDLCEDRTEKPDQAIDFLDNTIRPAVSRLVSNCFGEDQSPDDKILLKVVDSWTSLIQVLVKHQRRFWSDYLNPYDGDSWVSLRSTAQTRKFTAHFLASLIEKSESFYAECNNAILDLWVSSLVERGAVLKFQHQLTNALLNVDRENPLFQNLPFSINRESKRYEITLGDFSERRLSLISCLLSNMQHSLAAQSRSDNSRREEYKSLVERLMSGMKANYKDLGTTEDASHKPYVDFVHRVIEFLQQYAQGICPIDSFFTNPTSFPLPATDPTYITAKLKSYGLRLSTGKVSTQLIMFVQSVSERAAVDGQQIYLVDQLFTAMSDTFETGNYGQPTLRLFFLHCIFPAYVENVFYTPAAWILAKPILQSTGRAFRDLFLDLDVNSEECLSAIIDMISAYLEAVHRALCQLLNKPKLLREPSALLTLPSIFETITSVLPVVDYIERVSCSATSIISYVKSFRQFAIFAVNFLLGRIDPTSSLEVDTATNMISVPPPSTTSQLPKFFPDARDFASRELRNWLKDGWSFHGGKYYVRRGSQPKEISVTDPEDGGMASLLGSIEIFFGTMEGLEVFPRIGKESDSRGRGEERGRVSSSDDLFI